MKEVYLLLEKTYGESHPLFVVLTKEQAEKDSVHLTKVLSDLYQSAIVTYQKIKLYE